MLSIIRLGRCCVVGRYDIGGTVCSLSEYFFAGRRGPSVCQR